MADPGGPPTLFKLAIDALVAGCKLGNYTPTMDPQKIPPAVGKSVLNQISLMDIIIIASNENLYGWIASILPDNFVSINADILSSGRPILLEFECDNRPTLRWDFVYLGRNVSIDQSQCFMLKIAGQFFPTERELKDFKSHYGFAVYSNSSAIMNAQTMELAGCSNYALLEKLLTVRHQRGLKTEFTDAHIAEPLQFSSEFFQNVKIFRDAKLNFTCYSFEEIVQTMTPWMSRILRINAKIPNWSSRDLRVFRRRLNLKEGTGNISFTYDLDFQDEEGCEYRKFHKIEDGKAKVFRFTSTESGKFTQMLYKVKSSGSI